MSRVKRGTTVKRRHKKIFSLAKGYRHGRKRLIKQAKQAVIKAKTNSYRDRKVKKRDFRSLWIIRINAATREHGLIYRDFINGLKKANITLNRKVLAHLAIHDTPAFEKIVDQAKASLQKK